MDIFAGYAKPWVHRLLMSFIGAYVDNLSPEQLNVGINNGNIDLRELKLKNSVLDKLDLPFGVVEGRIGRFALAINWTRKETPVTIEIEDVQLLIAASSATEYSREDEEKREQQLKLERLERAEAIRMGEATDSASFGSSYFNSIIARIVNNVQVKIKNVHLRYEDKQTVPSHPFAAGVTLASLSAISVDTNWKPKYLDASEQSIHKLVSLDSLAIYFNTDSQSIAGLPYEESKEAFRKLISSDAHPVEHQFVLRPVSGEGRVILNKEWGKNGQPHYDVQLLFNELGFTLDNDQYRDVISLADEYHIFSRQHKYRRYRPDDSEFEANKPRALWKFATTSIREEVHDKYRRWTWDYFRERRDDRHRYVELFKQKNLLNKSEEISKDLSALERKLSYNDIRFYRSIARSQLRKDKNAAKILEQNKKSQQSWSSWIWGSSTDSSAKPLDQMTDEEKRGLNEFLDYDENAELAEAFDPSRETISTRLKMHLNQGSFRLKRSPSNGASDIVSLVFDSFDMGGVQRRDNFEATLSLGNFRVFDGTTSNTLYKQIVHVKEDEDQTGRVESTEGSESSENAFFYLKYELRPLDDHADHGLTVKLRSMEILYQRGYVEAIVDFFKPPESQFQSVEALLNVAGETFEGIQKETRAGLEYALETHKTVDLRLDMHAPIIIIPESVTSEHCNHLVIDAGRVLVESKLASKDTLREIEKKRNMKYSDEDYKQLESMMYDDYSVKLIAAQFVIGDSLDACRVALQSENPDPRLHLLERVNIDLLAQNSIVPSARSLARMKMSGKLPNLHVNFSDSKYKTLMLLLDVALPRLGGGSKDSAATQQSGQGNPVFQPTVDLFGPGQAEYVVDDVSVEGPEGGSQTSHSTAKELSNIRQHQFELSFQVDSLQATISRTAEDGSERALGNLVLERFLLNFVMAKYEMKVDIDLKAIILKSTPPNLDPLLLVSTNSGASEVVDLMTIAYRRAQKASPDFMSVYEGYDQSVEVRLTTFVVRAVPEHVISLYDYIMSTFVPNRNGNGSQQPQESSVQEPLASDKQGAQQSTDQIRVRARLAEFQVILLDNAESVATLSLSSANVDVDLRENGIIVLARLGRLQLTDDSPIQTKSAEFKQLLSIEDNELAELRYETFSPSVSLQRGINSSVDLTTGSLKLHFLEAPLNSMYTFLLRFARLKGLYDAATEAAVQQAAKVERMAFKLNIRSPIVVFPVNPTQLMDVFILKLGEFSAQNRFENASQIISASLNGIQLVSVFHSESTSRLSIIDDVNISTDVTQLGSTEHGRDPDIPEIKIKIDISDVNLHLTEQQYCRLIILSQSVPAVFADSSMDEVEVSKSREASREAQTEAQTDLLPEISPTSHHSGQLPTKKLELIVSVETVKLHLYGLGAFSEVDLKTHGIAKFALSGTTMTLDVLTSGALQSQLWIKSFTMNNTRPGPTKFREIIPAADHGRDQLHCLFTSSDGPNAASQIVATVDSPRIIFSVEPIFALVNFFLSAFKSEAAMTANASEQTPEVIEPPESNTPRQLSFRFDLYDTLISLLEDDHKSDTQAISLSLARLSVSQQNALVLDISRLGMSLKRMNKQADSVRFLDEVDIKLASESRSEWNRRFTGINITVEQELVFRTSYRDILLISEITNKVVALVSSSEGASTKETKQAAFDNAASAVASRSLVDEGRKSSLAPTRLSHERSRSNLPAKVIMTTEELEASLQGFRIVLIEDLHEVPVLHLTAKTFSVSVTDWSSHLKATTTMPVTINYWNLKNSHWEPLIDPWSFTVSMHKNSSTNGITVNMSSSELLSFNVSSHFVELGISAAKTWNAEGGRVLERARGSYAPYRIRNRTGAPVFVWSDTIGSTNTGSADAVKLDQGSSVDWRFDDWKKTRENGVSSAANSVGIRFDGKPWEHLRSVPVDREGEFIYSLRPRTKMGYSKLMCEIVTKDNIKIVTLRSTYKVENQTFYPLEVALVDDTGHPVYPIEKLVPGDVFVLPIEAVTRNRIRVQPDAGFGYRWSQPLKWEDFRDIRRSAFTVHCVHVERKEAPFHFTVWPVWSSSARDYPQLKLNLRAPIEIENLLPFDIQYKVYDKDTNNNWNSFLRKGGNAPVHSVELSHLVLLSISILDTVFKPSDFTIVNADKKFEFDREYELPMSDLQGRKLNLKLNYIQFPEAGGAFKLQIYCPFIVINKTGMPFSVKCVRSAGLYKEVAGVTSTDELAKGAPFLLSHTDKKGNEFVFKIGDSSWSQTMRFDAPSAETAMVIPHMSQKSEINIGLSWSEGSGKYKLTKVIELTPRFFVCNELQQSIRFREVAAPPSGQSELNTTERSALQFMRMEERRLLTIAYPGLNAQWSAPIDMEAIGTVHVRMRSPGSTTRKEDHLINANIALSRATIFIVLRAHEGPWPVTIENKSSYEISIGQIDEIRERPDNEFVYRVKAGDRLPYAWDFPAMGKKKLYMSCNKRARKIDIMEIGVLPPLRHNSGTISLDVRAEGPSQLLTITDYREELSVYKPKRRNTGASLTRSDSSATSQEFEAVQEEVPPTLSITLDLEGLGLSLINKRLTEVVYLSAQKLKLEYSNSPVAQSANVAIGALQIDNQLHDAFFPVLLQPTPISKEDRGLAALPTVQASVIILNDSAHGVLFVKYASILLQALTIQIDEAFLYAILDLTKLEGVTWESETENVLIHDLDKMPEPTAPVRPGQDVYFEVLELQPIFLSVSFVRNIVTSGDDTQVMTSNNPLTVVLDILTMTLGNVEGIELQLNALGITDVRLTLPEIQSRLLYHYRQEVLRQIYRVLGSADFLGNPVGLFTNVSSGVADIFYEPWHGVVQHGGTELGIGIAKGAASFVKKTIFGLSDSFTKITSSVGKGLSAATLDADYQAKRRMNQRRNRPRHALVGVASGAEAFANSVASGVEGVLMKPLEGADAEGALGFFKGVGKGFVGAVTKPVVGVFDLAANVTEGIRNTTTVFDAPQRERVRKPRHVPADGVLEPYDLRKATGQAWLRDLHDGAYQKELYIAHINIDGTDNAVLLTNTRIISFSTRDLHVHWEMPLTSIAGVQGEHNGIRFVGKGGRDQFVIFQDGSAKNWFFDQVKSVVNSFNARRRLER